jgi:hypothetical protein
MSRTGARAKPAHVRVLSPLQRHCPGCGGVMRIRYENRRTLVMLEGAVRLRLKALALRGGGLRLPLACLPA